jgi:Ni/Fe-hydrogenase 1 B-type cytochrome subunit
MTTPIAAPIAAPVEDAVRSIPPAVPPTSMPGATSRVRNVIPLYVWQVPVRLTHWVTAAAIVVLTATGLYIADPFLIVPGGAVMFAVRAVHMAAAFTLVGSLLLRFIWLFAGNRFARWSAFIPTSRYQAGEIFRQAAFYAFRRHHAPRVLGHNQLAASAYVLLFFLLFLETVTGFALDGILGTALWASMFGWLVDLVGPQAIRLVHHVAMWGILAISIFHVYSSVLVDHIERCGLVSSIVTGYKFFTREEIEEARDGGASVLDEDAATGSVEPHS